MEDTIGARLRRAREQRRLTIAQVSDSTRVRPHYLQALENDDLSSLPSAAQARGFLRIYADFLDLSPDDLVPQHRPQVEQGPAASADTTASILGSEPRPARAGVLSRLRNQFLRRSNSNGSSRLLASRDPSAGSHGSAETPPDATDESAALSQAREATASPTGDSRAPSWGMAVERSAASAASSREAEGTVTTPLPPQADAVGVLRALRQLGRPTAAVAKISGNGGDERPVQAQGEEFAAPGSAALSQGPTPGPLHTQPSETVPLATETATEPSEKIFAEVGSQLRQRREMLSLTHEEVERHTRIRAAFLEALEQGFLEELPSPVQTRGILANYAGFLDLDSDVILLRFADGLQARHREQKPQWQPPRTRPMMTVHTRLPPLRSFIASDLFFGLGVAAILLLFAIWGISRVMSVRTSTPPRATSPSISEVLAATPLSTVPQEVTLIPAQVRPLPSTADTTAIPNSGALGANAAVQINLLTSERTYMRIIVDGEVEFEGRAEPGASYGYQAGRQIEVLAGNAAAVRVTHNGRDLGLLGGYSEVVNRIYTATGVFTPTATLPPTPTATPDWTATPSLAPTPTPSETPTAQSGG